MQLDGLQIDIGTTEHTELLDALGRAGVATNTYAQRLLDHEVFHRVQCPQKITVAVRSVAELGFAQGATLQEIYARAQKLGLALCPAVTGPYLRLEFLEQASSSNSVLSAGKKPDDSLTIASTPLGDEDYPKGFYLRVVDSVPWLRGYRCDDTHRFGLKDTFVFQEPRN